MGEVAKLEATEVAESPAQSESAALISMIERLATNPDVNMETIERMLALREKEQNRAAKTEYLTALSAMQADLPHVERKGVGHNKAKYARYEDLARTAMPVLGKHGFSLTFRIDHEDKIVTITGILGHRSGHQEETSLPLPADTSGNKNAVQSWGSSISYGKRYVALTLLGIATKDDDDGKASSNETISDEETEQLKLRLDKANATSDDMLAFCEAFQIDALGELPKTKMPNALVIIGQIKERRKDEK